MKTISFITTCMNRESNLEVTLPINLDLIKNHPNMEIIVLNYNSKGNLDKYIRTLNNTQLKYFKEPTEKYFNMSRAKNIGSRLSTSDYILNLDADNFLSEDYINRLLQIIDEDIDIISMSTCKPNTGLGGRLGCKVSVFNHLRGYDESLQGWGADDVDFENRAIHYGFIIGYITIIDEGKVVIPQTDSEKSKNYSEENNDILKTQKRNRELITNPYRSINNKGFGCCDVLDINNNTISITNIESNQLKFNIDIYNTFFNNNINNDLLIEFKKVFGNNPNLSNILSSANLFNMQPFYNFGTYFSNSSENNLCDPIKWCKGNIAAFFILASNSIIINTDVVALALVGLLYGRDVILNNENNRYIYDTYLKQYNCRFKQTIKIKK